MSDNSKNRIQDRAINLLQEAFYTGSHSRADPTPRPAHYAPMPDAMTRVEIVKEMTVVIDDMIKCGEEFQTRAESSAAELRSIYQTYKREQSEALGVQYEDPYKKETP